jgi:hypothetical protein
MFYLNQIFKRRFCPHSEIKGKRVPIFVQSAEKVRNSGVNFINIFQEYFFPPLYVLLSHSFKHRKLGPV